MVESRPLWDEEATPLIDSADLIGRKAIVFYRLGIVNFRMNH
ncbi:MAG: hypothetical protein QW542_06510 [Thermoproteota archaeon]